MSKTLNREFKEGEIVYVVDRWGTNNGTQAFATTAKILKVRENYFLAVVYGDIYQKYSFKDYGRLIFNTKSEAEKAAGKIPKPGSIVWVIDKPGSISKIIVKNIGEDSFSDTFDLTIELEDGKSISTDKIGTQVFLNEECVMTNE